MSELVHINDWELFVDGNEPRVRDIDIAERAGLSRSRNIRQTIKDNRQELEAHGELMEFAAGASELYGGAPGVGYMLNEAQSISIVALMRTKKAMQLRIALVQVFIAFRRGQFTGSATSMRLDIAHGPRIGEVVTLRAEMRDRCMIAARATRKSIQSIHGAVRRTFRVPGIYQVSMLAYPHVTAFLDHITLGRLILPAGKSPPLRLVAKDPRQGEMF